MLCRVRWKTPYLGSDSVVTNSAVSRLFSKDEDTNRIMFSVVKNHRR